MNNKASAFFLIMVFSMTVVKASAPDTSRLNRVAPRIVFQQSIDKHVQADFYNGKILVLDFWATWCAPCIAGFPHFNELSEKYGGKDVVFAGITNEPLPVVDKFFARTKKELKAIKLIDTTRATMNAYNVLTPSLEIGIPYCVIIDKNNIVRWTGQTYELTDSIINKIIQQGQYSAMPGNVHRTVKPVSKPIASRAFFSFNVARPDTTKHNYEGDGETAFISNSNSVVELQSANKSLSDLIEQISGYSKSRFVTNNEVKLKQHMDISFNIGRDSTYFKDYKNKILENSSVKNFIISLLGEAFKFNAQMVTQRQSHYELIVTDTAKWHSFRSMSKHRSYDFDHFPMLEIVGFSLPGIITFIESNANIIITSQIKDNASYDVSLNANDIETLKKSLRFHGLGLIKSDSEVKLLNIDFN